MAFSPRILPPEERRQYVTVETVPFMSRVPGHGSSPLPSVGTTGDDGKSSEFLAMRS